MKYLSVIVMTVVVMLMFVVPAVGQTATTLASAKAFANDSSYTFTAPLGMGKYNRISGLFSCTDTVNVRIIAQTKPKGGSSWTAKDTTTINVNSSSGTISEYVYRDNTTEKIPGVTNDVRYVFEFISSGNGVAGTRTFTYVLNYGK